MKPPKGGKRVHKLELTHAAFATLEGTICQPYRSYLGPRFSKPQLTVQWSRVTCKSCLRRRGK